MTVKRAKIQIDVEATTEGAVRGMDRVASSTDKARKAVEKQDAVLKRLSQDYKISQARLANYTDNVRKFAAAEDKAARASRARALAMRGTTKESQGAAGAIMGIGRAAAQAGPAIAAGAVVVTGAAMAAKTWGEETLKTTNVFNNLPYRLDPARKATKGLADDMTLARNAIMANQAGVATSAQAYGELVGMAQTLALKMGRDVNDTVERVTMGIAKQEREILDELVILPRMEDMWKSYAEQLGKTTGELSDHEKNAAFTKTAIEALREATQGVEIDMDGAAGSIARTSVALENLKTRIYGGHEATMTLREGVGQLDAAVLKQVNDFDSYGASVTEVKRALLDAGVATSEYRFNSEELEKQIRKVLDAESKRIVRMAERGQLTEEHLDDIERLRAVKGILSEVDEKLIYKDLKRLDIENERERVAARAAQQETRQREERLLEIEEQLAFGRAAGISQEQINLLVQEEAELRALVLEAQGEGAKAAEVRRKAELAALTAMGADAKPKRGGGRRKSDDRAAARRRIAAEQELARWERMNDLMVARDAARFEQRQQLNPFSQENLERQLANVIDFEDRRAKLVLDSRLREIEAQRAAGADPVELARQEAEAQLELLAVQEQVAQRRFDREITLATQQGELKAAADLEAEREITMLELRDQAEAQHHAAQMARLDEERRKREETHARRVEIAQQSVDLVLGSASAIVSASIIEGGALKRVVAEHARAEGMRHGLILGPSAMVQGGFHALTGNLPLATALFQQGAQHFAFAGAMAGLGAAVGGMGPTTRRGGSGGAFDASNFGGSPANDTGARGSRGGGRFDIGGQVPISAEAQLRTSGQAAAANAAPAGVTVVVNMGGLSVGGKPDESTAQDMEKAGQLLGRRVGVAVAGGGRR